MKKVLGLSVFLSLIASHSNAQTVNWVYANGYAKDHLQVGVLADEFIKRVQDASNDRIKIRHVSGGALLKPENMIEGLRGKVADMGSAVVSFFPGQLPISATLASTVDLTLGNKLDVAGSSAITTQLLNEFPEFSQEYEKHGLKVLWFVAVPAYAIITNEPVTNSSQLNGKKIRTLGNVLPKLLNAAGAVPVSVAFSEIYTGMQTGVVDGAMTDPPAMLSGKFQEVAKYVLTTGPKEGAYNAIAPVAYMVNMQSWNALPADLQTAVLKASEEMTAVGAAKTVEVAAEAFKKLEAAGVTVSRLTEEDTAQWAQKSPDFMLEAAKTLNGAGAPGDKLIARYKELAKGYIDGTWKPGR